MSESIDLVQLTDETKKLTAMVVEDEVSANEMLSSTFKSFFADVTSAFDGKYEVDVAVESTYVPVPDEVQLTPVATVNVAETCTLS